MESGSVPTKNAEFQWIVLMDATESLAVDAKKVCVSNASQKRW